MSNTRARGWICRSRRKCAGDRTAPAEPPPQPARPGRRARASRATQRSQAKENRRQALLSAAAALFAVDGFNRVSLEDLGAAAGVSGPAVYRHFAGKQAVLGALLLSVSQDLLDGGRRVVADSDGAARRCAAWWSSMSTSP